VKVERVDIMRALLYAFALLVLRLILSAVFHLDEMHLAYNMGSFMWKGVQLEPILGPVVRSHYIVVSVSLSPHL